MLTIKVIHEHHHHVHNPEGDYLMAIAASFAAQVQRLSAFVTSLEGGAAGQSDEDAKALSDALDTAGAPPATTTDGTTPITAG